MSGRTWFHPSMQDPQSAPIREGRPSAATVEYVWRELEGIQLGLAGSGQQRREMVTGQALGLAQRVAHRLSDPGGPLFVVLAGSTGAGKSSILNGFAGRVVSSAGVLRPTTRRPVAFAARKHARRCAALPVEVEVEPGGWSLLEHAVVIDSPDLDSDLESNRIKAQQLIQWADITLYVTTPQRYADEIPVSAIEVAASLGSTVIPVLNRYRSGAEGVSAQITAVLRSRGVASMAPVTVAERPGSLIPAVALTELRTRLSQILREKEAVVDSILHHSGRELRSNLGELVTLMESHEASLSVLKDLASELRSGAHKASVLDALVASEEGRLILEANPDVVTHDTGDLGKMLDGFSLERSRRRMQPLLHSLSMELGEDG